MVNQQLVDYLISLQSGNYSKTQVKRVLLEVGWHERDVDEAFKIAQSTHDISMPHLGLQEKSFLIQSLSVLLILMTGTFLIFGAEPTATGNVVLNVAPVQSLGVSSEVRVIEEQSSHVIESVQTPEPQNQQISVEEHITSPSQPAFTPAPTPSVTVLSAPPQEECDASRARDDSCLLRQALEQKDERLCNRIRDNGLYSSCMTSMALIKADVSLCHETSDSDLCYNEYALASGDKSACARIVNRSDRETCQS